MKNKDKLITNVKNFIIALVLFFINSAILLWLWNALMPPLFNFIQINYWQAAGIYIICNILFKSPKLREKDD